MKLKSEMFSFHLAHCLKPPCQRAQLGDRVLPCQDVVQKALDLEGSLIGLQKLLGRDIVGVLGHNAAIDDNRVSPNDSEYELGRKPIAVVLAEAADIVMVCQLVELGLELDETLGCRICPERPGHFAEYSQP